MPEHDPHLSRLKLPTIIKGAGILFSGRVTARVLGYAYNILAAKKVGLKGFGVYTLGLAIIRAVAIGLPEGQSSPVVRYVSIYNAVGDEARVKGTIRFALMATGLISVISLAAFLLFADLIAVGVFRQPQLSSVLTPLAFSIPFARLSSVLLLSTVGLHIMAFRTLTKDLLEPVVTIGTFLLLFLYGFKLNALIFAYLSSAMAGFVLAYLLFSKTFTHIFSSPFFPNPSAKRIGPISESKTIFKFAFPIAIAEVFGRLQRWGDVLVLGYFAPVSQVGLYTIIYKTVSALNDISTSMIGVFNPMIGPSFEKGAFSTLQSQLQIVSRWTFSLAFPLVLFALFHTNSILAVLGDQFIGGELCLTILLLGFLFEMTTAPTAQVLTMSGKSQITLINTVGAGLINFVLFLIFIPRYGIEGASFAVALSLLLLGVTRVVEVRAFVGVNPLTASYLKPLIAGCSSLVIALWMEQRLPANRYVFLASSFVAFSLSYLAALVVIGLDPADRFILAKVKARLLSTIEERR